MKLSKIFLTFATSALLSAAPMMATASGTHSHSHGSKAAEFDPTETEFGEYKPDMKPSKTIEVTLSDTMKFSPETITVKTGDIVEFTHKNTGKLVHEFVLGTEESLAEHAKMMQKFPNMEHEEAYMIHVGPGKEGKMLWKFTKAGEFGFGCLVPGHYEAGMKGTITVQAGG